MLGDGTADYTNSVSRTQSSTTTFAHAGLKNTSTQSAENETIAATKVYDAFGNTVSSSGSWSGPFQYAGNYGYQQDANGLKLLGHRYYDSTTGRFATGDPIGNGVNWYVYASNNPVTSIDPTGLFTVFGFEFTLEIVAEGLDTGLHGMLSGVTFGLYDGGDYKDDTGFGGSQLLGKVGITTLVLAGAVWATPSAAVITAGDGAITLGGSGAIIGNLSSRVQVNALVLDLEYFVPTSGNRFIGWLQNVAWIMQQKVTQDFILDIGPVPGTAPYGKYYPMERFIVNLF